MIAITGQDTDTQADRGPAVPEGAVSERAGPEGTASEGTASEGTASEGTASGGAVPGGATPAGGPARTGPDPVQVYALGADAEETARLERQSGELRPEAEALLAGIALRPGDAAADLGCGPSGILGLLSAAVGPGGRVVGLDAGPVHVAKAAATARGAGQG